MILEFRSKANTTDMSSVSEELGAFVLKNTDFLEPLFTILSRKPTAIQQRKDVEDRIKSQMSYANICNNPNYETFISILHKLYNTSDKSLARRRGEVLELIVREASPKPKLQFKLIVESHVYSDGQKISEKDIDVVFDGDHIDAIECKAILANYLFGVPLPKRCKEKLLFMCDLKKLATQNSKNCNLFFATYNKENTYEEDILSESGFNEFVILTSSDIKRRLLA
jgi:hypothetical protein